MKYSSCVCQNLQAREYAKKLLIKCDQKWNAKNGKTEEAGRQKCTKLGYSINMAMVFTKKGVLKERQRNKKKHRKKCLPSV